MLKVGEQTTDVLYWQKTDPNKLCIDIVVAVVVGMAVVEAVGFVVVIIIVVVCGFVEAVAWWVVLSPPAAIAAIVSEPEVDVVAVETVDWKQAPYPAMFSGCASAWWK